MSASYIYQQKGWPRFVWNEQAIISLLAEARYHQGRLLGQMESLGFYLQNEASLQTLTVDVLKSSEIEGDLLNQAQVRSSIARRLGLDVPGLVPADRHVEGVVEMMLDATQHYAAPLTRERLFAWHASMFPTGRNGMRKIVTGAWRRNTKANPMQVVSGAVGRETVHFEAPASDKLEKEMERFLHWFNAEPDTDPVLKAAIAHLWFVTIHPFSDGNGRIARAIADMLLARADGSPKRFYSMSAQIRVERNAYYRILERTQKGTLDVTAWLVWFLKCLHISIVLTDFTLAAVIKKARFWENIAGLPLNERQRKMLNKLLDDFEGRLTSSKWAKMMKCSHDTAVRDIQQLMHLGVLVKGKEGGKNTSYGPDETLFEKR
jgi:Fic family protein